MPAARRAPRDDGRSGPHPTVAALAVAMVAAATSLAAWSSDVRLLRLATALLVVCLVMLEMSLAAPLWRVVRETLRQRDEWARDLARLTAHVDRLRVDEPHGAPDAAWVSPGYSGVSVLPEQKPQARGRHVRTAPDRITVP